MRTRNRNKLLLARPARRPRAAWMRAGPQETESPESRAGQADSVPRRVLETLARALVEKADRVEVREVSDSQSLVLELKVADDETGKVIGKQGRTAKAIRSVVKAAAGSDRRKVIVEIL